MTPVASPVPERPVRIGINALFLIPGGVGGTELYVRNLLAGLAAVDRNNQYFIFRNAESGSDLVPGCSNFFDCPQKVRAAFRPARILYEQTLLIERILRLKLDVLFNAGTTAPILCPIPMVSVFYDLQYKRHPEYFRWFDLPFWRLLLPLSARRSRRIVAMSEAARSDIVEYFPWTSGRIDIVPHGVEHAFSEIAQRRSRDRTGDAFILAVSTLHPHKNLSNLLRAFAQFRKTAPHYRLVVAGLKGFEAVRLDKLRSELQLVNSVDFPGWIERSALYELFARARAFIYPSRFEGFGIPVLEAMTAGLPTACSAIPSLREVAGDAVRYFDPDDVEDMLRALHEITQDGSLRARLETLGPERGRQFSWTANAGKLSGILCDASRRESNSAWKQLGER